MDADKSIMKVRQHIQRTRATLIFDPDTFKGQADALKIDKF